MKSFHVRLQRRMVVPVKNHGKVKIVSEVTRPMRGYDDEHAANQALASLGPGWTVLQVLAEPN